MLARRVLLPLVVLAGLLLIVGCAKHYRITQELEIPLEKTFCSIGEIEDGLPSDVEVEDKPTEMHYQKLRSRLHEELANKEVFGSVGMDDDQVQYEVTGRIIEFKRGSGVVRFFIGFGLGDARLTVELKLLDRETGNVIFAGNFKRTVKDWGESGDKVFKDVARDFAKALEKASKKQTEG